MGNKKLNSRKKKRQQEASKSLLLQKGRKRRSAGTIERNKEEWEQVNAKIGVLEEFITGSVIKQERLRRQRREGIMPPPDHIATNRQRHPRRMIRSQEEAYYQRRQQHGLTFLALFIAACALAWYLLGSGGFQ